MAKARANGLDMVGRAIPHNKRGSGDEIDCPGRVRRHDCRDRTLTRAVMSASQGLRHRQRRSDLFFSIVDVGHLDQICRWG